MERDRRPSDEFFAGEGSRPALRTIFRRRRWKSNRSISFQGARPERFAEERSAIARRARDAVVQFEQVSLRVSFRSSIEVLKLVDHVFADADARRGMGADGEARDP